MTYFHIDAELEGIDGYPEYELGDRFGKQSDERIVTIGDETTAIVGEVEEDLADVAYLAKVHLQGDVYDPVKDLVSDNDFLFVFDYAEDDYFIAEEL